MEAKGPVWITLALIVANFVLYLVGKVPDLNFWQVLVALLGLWLFGCYPERRLGPIAYLAIYVVLAASAGFLVGAVDDNSGLFAIGLFLPVLALGLLHLALAPRSKILCFVPVPLAMTFYQVPTIAILVGWVGLEVLLTAA